MTEKSTTQVSIFQSGRQEKTTSVRRRIGSIEILDNRPPVGTQQFDSHPGLKPSYVHVACAVSGYSDLNRYNSSQRNDYRSRDDSPVKITWIRSPTSSHESQLKTTDFCRLYSCWTINK